MTQTRNRLFSCDRLTAASLSRREMFASCGSGFGNLALAAMIQEQLAADQSAADPLAARQGHFSPRAKRVIFIFLAGGPSQVDLFQHKPQLAKRHGELPPQSIAHDNEFTTEGFESTRLQQPIARFRRHGDSGIWLSDLLPHLSRQIDRLTLLNGMVADNPAHTPAIRQLFCGSPFLVQPSLGAWTSYGLGTENRNLPSFVTIDGHPFSYAGAFLPAIHQGTKLEGKPNFTIRHLKNDRLDGQQQTKQQDLLRSINRQHLDGAVADPAIEGLIDSYELAFRMQARTDGIVDVSTETEETRSLYGIDEKPTDVFGRSLLVARRLSEAGVRFVQVYSDGWDHHTGISSNLPKSCASHDKPIAGLIEDLEQRGLLDDTLLVCAGEFGRTSFDQDLSRGKNPPKTYGRGHSPLGFSIFMAGGGVRKGFTYGDTDELGYRAVEGIVHVHDLHATILHLIGLDHERLTYRHGARDVSLTDVHGRVVEEILA
ncbi:MAG: DUF1501 domain-containing protein [Fuerstiella sp.]|nr:DUF1501 domain-containing protein [Fuerstiella sp.]